MVRFPIKADGTVTRNRVSFELCTSSYFGPQTEVVMRFKYDSRYERILPYFEVTALSSSQDFCWPTDGEGWCGFQRMGDGTVEIRVYHMLSVSCGVPTSVMTAVFPDPSLEYTEDIYRDLMFETDDEVNWLYWSDDSDSKRALLGVRALDLLRRMPDCALAAVHSSREEVYECSVFRAITILSHMDEDLLCRAGLQRSGIDWAVKELLYNINPDRYRAAA